MNVATQNMSFPEISRCSSHAKSAEQSRLMLNRDEILEGIRILGRGIVKNSLLLLLHFHEFSLMDEVDVLAGKLCDAQVDTAALGEHPRFSLYKNAGRAAEQQAERRRDAIERQRSSRFDHFNHTRMLAESETNDEEGIELLDLEQGESYGDAKPHFSRKNCSKSRNNVELKCLRYADQLMLSEWLVDIPDQLSSEWMMVPSPVETYTILDCILDSKKTFYCLDVLAWSGMDMSANPFDFRQFILNSKLKELPELAVATKQFPHRFLSLPCCKCEPRLMEEMMRNGFDFELDGLLYYHSGVVYEAGQSPLVGWLKPWMLPEILNVKVPENTRTLMLPSSGNRTCYLIYLTRYSIGDFFHFKLQRLRNILLITIYINRIISYVTLLQRASLMEAVSTMIFDVLAIG
ncbi:hypothetical protein DICVIV_06192 [Dictyocaulus viviparus]|uniref:Snurportin-1 n=1 Tax=Dictyocaulus viviparus TaxID=29172 RepID=A0A0D8XT93_DICVI|nr:hypothetical protein DICVIV_06192 [Dictyocaulus viviparus]